MADDKRTVELEVIANTQKAEQNLNKIANQAKTIGSTEESFAKVAAKHQKQRSKLDEKINNPRKRKKVEDGAKAMVDHEKEKLKLLEKQNTELEKYARTQDKINKGKGKGPSDGGGSGDFLGGLKKKLGLAIVAAAGAAVGTVARQISDAHAAYVEYGKSRVQLAGMGLTPGSAVEVESLNKIRDASVQYGYGGPEAMEQAAGVGRATGQYGAVEQAQMLTRGTSMQMDDSIGLMQTLTQAGSGFGGKAGSSGFTQLRKAVALGFNSGMDDARLPEYLRGVQKVVQAQGARVGGEVDFGEYGRMFQLMGKFGGPALQGDRGAAMFQKLNEGIVRPGGGEAGQALMMQAMGFGVPGGDRTYYEARKQQQKGATPENVKRLFQMTELQEGGGEEQIMALSEMLGIDNFEALEKMREVVEKKLDPEATDEELQKLINETKDPQTRAAEAMEGVGKVIQDSVGFQARLEKLGEDNYDAILEMQKSINKMVDEVLPAANAALGTISNTTTVIANLMGANMGVDPTKGVQTKSSLPFGLGERTGYVSGQLGLAGGEFDPAYIAGNQNMDAMRRKAIGKVIESNPEAKTMGHRNLRDIYRQMTSTERGSPSAENQQRMFKKLFGEGGEFAPQVKAAMAELVEINRSIANNANKVAEGAAESARQRNSGPATSAESPNSNMSMPADVQY